MRLGPEIRQMRQKAYSPFLLSNGRIAMATGGQRRRTIGRYLRGEQTLGRFDQFQARNFIIADEASNPCMIVVVSRTGKPKDGERGDSQSDGHVIGPAIAGDEKLAKL